MLDRTRVIDLRAPSEPPTPARQKVIDAMEAAEAANRGWWRP